jgi:hypothetical protein
VKPDALDAADAEEREAVIVLQTAELTLNSGAAAIEAAPLVATERDAELPLRLVLAERSDRGTAALVALGVDAVVVVALIGHDSCESEAASASRVK